MTDNTISFDAVLDDGISGPLSGINRRFRGLVTVGRQVGRVLAPIGGQFSQIASAIIGVEGARRAINAAGAQAKAEQQILSALKGNTEQLQAIVDLTKEVQGRAVFNDADLLASSNTLLQMGVSIDNIDTALQASVETASALGLTLESTTKSFGLIESAGLAGELGERIPFLRELIAEGRSFAEIADVVIDRFGGVAQAAVDGPFGELQIQLDSTTDILERFGNEFIVVINPALSAFNSLLSRAADVASSPEFGAFFSTIAEVIPLLAPIAATVVSLGAANIAIKGIVFSLGGVVSLVSGIVGSVGSLLFSIGAVPALILLVLSRIREVRELVSGLTDSAANLITGLVGDGLSNIREAIGLLRDGKADVEDVVAVVTGELSQFGLRFESGVIAPIRAGLNAIKEFALGSVDLVISAIRTGFAIVVVGLIESISGLFSRIGVDLGVDEFSRDLQEGIEESAEAGRQAIARISDAFNVKEKIAEDRAEIASQLAEIEQATDSLRGNLESRRVRTLETNLDAFSERTRSEIEALSAEFQERLATSFTLGDGQAIRTEDLFKDLTADNITNSLSLVNGQVREGLVGAFTEAINELERLDKASATEVANLRISLLDKVNENRIAALENSEAEEGSISLLEERLTLLDGEREGIERIIAGNERALEALQDRNGSLEQQAAIIGNLTTANESLRNNQAEQLQVLEAVSRAEEELNNLRTQQAVSAQEQIAIVTSVAEAEAEKVADAYTQLNERRESIADRFSTGVLTRSGVIRAEEEALATFNAAASSSEAQLQELISRFPEAANNVEILRAKLQELKDTAGNPEEEGGLFTGLLQGARATTAEFDNLQLQGEKAGSTLTTAFGEGLTDVFANAGEGFRAFAGNFLLLISRMIIRLLVFRALAAAIGGLGGGGSTPAAGGIGPDVPSGVFDPSAGIPGFNDGGRVPGPNINRDVVLAKLTPGEEVVDRETAAFYGRAFFERLKNRLIPKMPISGGSSITPSTFLNSGGRASGTTMGNSNAPNLAVILPDNQSLERQLANGSPALQEWLQEQGYVREGFDR